ncbi:hypothetical protein [Geomicrobium sp. JCM 19038]|nr:hypothetical protein [Geomicrobium sp. JCM 19038]
MYDLIIKNGVVVLPHEVKNVDIGIQNGKIVALSSSSSSKQPRLQC